MAELKGFRSISRYLYRVSRSLIPRSTWRLTVFYTSSPRFSAFTVENISTIFYLCTIKYLFYCLMRGRDNEMNVYIDFVFQFLYWEAMAIPKRFGSKMLSERIFFFLRTQLCINKMPSSNKSCYTVTHYSHDNIRKWMEEICVGSTKI